MEILKYGNPTLKKKSEEVTIFDDQLASYADQMYQLMRDAKGIGLAAPQLGLLIRLLIIDIEDEGGRLDLVNPCIVSQSDDLEEAEEGCLSIPGIYAKVMRHSKVSVEAQNLKGEIIKLEAESFLARVIQHEIDHLEGILFIDRLEELDKKRFKSELKKIKKKNTVCV